MTVDGKSLPITKWLQVQGLSIRCVKAQNMQYLGSDISKKCNMRKMLNKGKNDN